MKAMVTVGAISCAKVQSNRHYQQNQHPVFLQAGCPSCRPTNSVKALKGKISHSMDLLTPSSPGVFQLYLWPLIAPGYIGGGLPCITIMSHIVCEKIDINIERFTMTFKVFHRKWKIISSKTKCNSTANKLATEKLKLLCMKACMRVCVCANESNRYLTVANRPTAFRHSVGPDRHIQHTAMTTVGRIVTVSAVVRRPRLLRPTKKYSAFKRMLPAFLHHRRESRMYRPTDVYSGTK